jgi:hypothetical protein
MIQALYSLFFPNLLILTGKKKLKQVNLPILAGSSHIFRSYTLVNAYIPEIRKLSQKMFGGENP